MTIRIPLTALALSLALSGAAYAETPADKGMKKAQHMEKGAPALPDDKAKLFRESMEKARTQNAGLMEKARALREEQKALLTAEKFDKAAYLAKSKEIGAVYTTISQNKHEAFASVAAQFTPEERKALAKSFHKGRHGKDRSHKRSGQ